MTMHPDGRRSHLRTVMAELETAMTAAGAEGMRPAWNRLVAALDLGPEPEVRACPSCSALAMRAATLCGHCWSPLAPA
jgi:hypothetical protein